MPAMTDPMNALVQFQQAYEAGLIPVQPGRLDASVLMAADQPNGKPRFSYMRVDGLLVTALVMFAQNGMQDGHPVFNIGYAVPASCRGRGLAKATLVAALAELSVGLAGAKVPVIHVETVISPDNLASHAVAKAIFDDAPARITDSQSGEPALLYTRKVACGR